MDEKESDSMQFTFSCRQPEELTANTQDLSVTRLVYKGIDPGRRNGPPG